MIYPFDYVLDNKDRFWIVKKNFNGIYGNLVFIPDKNGTRYNYLTKKRYSKIKYPDCSFNKISKSKISKVFHPKECFKKKYPLLKNPWKDLADSLINLVGESNIGIFGSTLIGFKLVKDIDFVIYGEENCKTIKKNILSIKKKVLAKNISLEHIRYQTQKYNEFHSEKNDFLNLLKNKWSSLQFDKILSTIRFVDLDREFLDVPFGKDKIIRGKVIREEADFLPRVFYLDSSKGIIQVITYFWAYQSCVKKGDAVEVFGKYDSKNKILFLSNNSHWIKFQK